MDEPVRRQRRKPQGVARPADEMGRVPPHDVHAEMSLLGAMLLDPKGDATSKVIDYMGPQGHTLFYRFAHQLIFASMRAVFREHGKLDIVLLAADMRRAGTLEGVGDMDYLMQLGSYVPTIAHIGDYAKVVMSTAKVRAVIRAANEALDLAYSNGNDGEFTPDQIAEQAKRLVEDAAATGGDEGEWVPVSKVVDEVAEEIRAAVAKEEQPNKLYIPTGFRELEKWRLGWKGGWMNILAARPKVGKSILSMQFAYNAAVFNFPTGIFSLEMNSGDHIYRMAGAIAGVDSERIESGEMSDDEIMRVSNALRRIRELPLYFDDAGCLTASQVVARAKRAIREHDVKFIVIDHGAEVAADPKPGKRQVDGENEKYTEIFEQFRLLAKETGRAVLVVHQLNRNNEHRDNKRPRMGDLRGSGSIEQKAWRILLIHRPSYYEQSEDDKEGGNSSGGGRGSMEGQNPTLPEKAEIIVAANRKGRTGTLCLDFVPAYTRFQDMGEI